MSATVTTHLEFILRRSVQDTRRRLRALEENYELHHSDCGDPSGSPVSLAYPKK